MSLLDRLRAHPGLAEWMATLDAVEENGPLDLPDGVGLVERLLDMAVPQEDINAILAHRPHPGTDAWQIVERSAALLRQGFGRIEPPPAFPSLAIIDDPFLNWSYVYVFAAVLPAIRAWHRERGIDEAITRRTLEDVGRQMVHQRRRTGRGGFTTNQDWPTRHYSGRLFQLGRLQFERCPIGGTTAAEIRAGGYDVHKGDPILSIHIPDYYGPLDPAECDASFAMARAFFARCFPEERYAAACCYSWLLAPQLAEYLPPESNILAFQHRFTINQRETAPEDAVFIEFVFGATLEQLDTLPQETTLQRAIVGRLREGRHWYTGVGWIPLDAPRR